MKDERFESAPDLGEALDRAVGQAETRSIAIDAEKYRAYLDDPSLSAAQKDEILGALWTIIVAFVELGFGVHPIQQACGQVEKELDPKSMADSDELCSEASDQKQEFNNGPERG